MAKPRPKKDSANPDDAPDFSRPTVAAADRAEVEARMYEDLEGSDLDRAYIKRMAVKPYIAAEMNALSKGAINVDCYLFPYASLDGRPTGYWRAKLLDPAIHKDGSTQKYYQPPHTAPRLYLPPLSGHRTWTAIAADASIDLFITEGEKKAAAGAKRELNVVGVGGVSSYGSKKRQQILLPDLTAFKLEGRKVYLIFDSDTFVRADLMAALVELADRLTRLGAQVYRVDLPQSLDGSKVGLDDYFVNGGTVESFAKLPSEMFELGRELLALNRDYAVLLTPPGSILRRRDNYVMSRRDFDLEAANRLITVWSSTGQPRQVSAGDEWARWKYRGEVSRLVYEPRRWDEPRDLGDGSINLWSGWGFTKPERDAEAERLFLALIGHLTGDAEPDMRKWLLRWLALPIVRPGAKMQSAPALYGIQGAGKTILGYMMREVYGAPNFNEVKQGQLNNSFNPWSAHVQIILADEIISTDKRTSMDKIKGMITQAYVTVNEKYEKPYTLRDSANFLFASNNPVPLALDDDDRRFGVIHVLKKLPDDLRAAIGEMYMTETERNAIAWYLLSKVDLAGFNEHTEPPMSADKLSLIDDTRTSFEGFVDACIKNYDGMFALGDTPARCDFQTAESVAALYKVRHPDNRLESPDTVGRRYFSKRADAILRLPQVPTKRTPWLRAYAFRNLDFWRKATRAQIIAHWNESFDLMEQDSSAKQVADSNGKVVPMDAVQRSKVRRAKIEAARKKDGTENVG